MAGSDYGTRTIFQGVRSKKMNGYTGALKYLSYKNEFNWDTFSSIHHSIPLPFISFPYVFSMNRFVPSSVCSSLCLLILLFKYFSFQPSNADVILVEWSSSYSKILCIKRLIFECRFHTLNHNQSSEFLKDLLTLKVSNQT